MDLQPGTLCHDSRVDRRFLTIFYRNLLKHLCFGLQARTSFNLLAGLLGGRSRPTRRVIC